MQHYDLPLSWILKSKTSGHFFEKITLFRNFKWYALSHIPDDKSWIDEFIKGRENKILIRGVSSDAAALLKSYGYKRHLVGEEAIINLSSELNWKKSVKELCRRGRKKGYFREIPYSSKTAARLDHFKRLCRHGGKPELKYLFNNKFMPSTRLFVIHDENEDWMGAIVISKNNVRKYQCELLLKRKGSYQGVMEYLVIEIAKTLKSEGVNEFSLGEVPFVKMDFESKILNLLISFLHPLILLSYSYRGLFFFKNKFSPEWKPVYLCANRNIQLVDLFILSLKTNFLKLLLFKIKNQILTVIKLPFVDPGR